MIGAPPGDTVIRQGGQAVAPIKFASDYFFDRATPYLISTERVTVRAPGTKPGTVQTATYGDCTEPDGTDTPFLLPFLTAAMYDEFGIAVAGGPFDGANALSNNTTPSNSIIQGMLSDMTKVTEPVFQTNTLIGAGIANAPYGTAPYEGIAAPGTPSKVVRQPLLSVNLGDGLMYDAETGTMAGATANGERVASAKDVSSHKADTTGAAVEIHLAPQTGLGFVDDTEITYTKALAVKLAVKGGMTLKGTDGVSDGLAASPDGSTIGFDELGNLTVLKAHGPDGSGAVGATGLIAGPGIKIEHVAAPTAAPVLTAGTGTAIPAGDYDVVFTWVATDSDGVVTESGASPRGSYHLSAAGGIHAVLPAAPSGAGITSAKVYITQLGGSIAPSGGTSGTLPGVSISTVPGIIAFTDGSGNPWFRFPAGPGQPCTLFYHPSIRVVSGSSPPAPIDPFTGSPCIQDPHCGWLSHGGLFDTTTAKSYTTMGGTPDTPGTPGSLYYLTSVTPSTSAPTPVTIATDPATLTQAYSGGSDPQTIIARPDMTTIDFDGAGQLRATGVGGFVYNAEIVTTLPTWQQGYSQTDAAAKIVTFFDDGLEQRVAWGMGIKPATGAAAPDPWLTGRVGLDFRYGENPGDGFVEVFNIFPFSDWSVDGWLDGWNAFQTYHGPGVTVGIDGVLLLSGGLVGGYASNTLGPNRHNDSRVDCDFVWGGSMFVGDINPANNFHHEFYNETSFYRGILLRNNSDITFDSGSTGGIVAPKHESGPTNTGTPGQATGTTVTQDGIWTPKVHITDYSTLVNEGLYQASSVTGHITPAVVAGASQLYAKTSAGVTSMYMLSDAGVEYDLRAAVPDIDTLSGGVITGFDDVGPDPGPVARWGVVTMPDGGVYLTALYNRPESASTPSEAIPTLAIPGM